MLVIYIFWCGIVTYYNIDKVMPVQRFRNRAPNTNNQKNDILVLVSDLFIDTGKSVQLKLLLFSTLKTDTPSKKGLIEIK